jgi:hypothetical protein
MFVFLQDAYACSFRYEQASGTPIKRAVGVWVIAQSGIAAMSQHKEDERV